MREGTWLQEVGSELLCPFQLAKKTFGRNAEEIRDTFKGYFYGPGAESWQWKVLIW